jgi:hypothetical protein
LYSIVTHFGRNQPDSPILMRTGIFVNYKFDLK